MSEFLLSTDPLHRAWTTFELDSDGETIIIRRYWESESVDEVLDFNAQEDNHVTQSGDMRRAARIPDAVYYEWWLKRGVRAWDPNHQDAVKALLNDIEYRKLRTGGGRL